LLAYWFGLVIGVVAPAGIGVFLLLPREVITTLICAPTASSTI
jgi:hypothetical protein